MRGAALGEAVENVPDDRAGRRSDDADDSRQERQRALALGREQALRGQRLAAPLEQGQQRALAGELETVDYDLVFGAAGIGGEPAGRDDLRSVFRAER